MKPIKVFLIRSYHKNENSAAFNRDEAVQKMVEKTFNSVIINPFFHRRNTPSNINYSNNLLNRIMLINSVIKKLLLYRNTGFNVVVFLRSADIIVTIVIWNICRLRGFKLAKEKNEYPDFVIQRANNFKLIIKKYIVFPWFYKLYDVFFVISDELKQYYGYYLKKLCVIQLLPMSVDFERFEVEQKNNKKDRYIFYAGSLSEKKDGVQSLITSFAKTTKSFPDLRLLIAGKAETTQDSKTLFDLIEQYGLNNKVSFLGFVNRNEIPKYLCSAKIVVLPRPDSIQARGGFPSKLGEYLASGRPVVTTKVGEIPKYLSDDEVFYISPENIVNDLEKSIHYILNDYERALKVAFNGQKAAKRYFSIDAVSQYLKQGLEKAFKDDIKDRR